MVALQAACLPWLRERDVAILARHEVDPAEYPGVVASRTGLFSLLGLERVQAGLPYISTAAIVSNAIAPSAAAVRTWFQAVHSPR